MALLETAEQIAENKRLYWLSEALLAKLKSEYTLAKGDTVIGSDQEKIVDNLLLMANYLHRKCYPKPNTQESVNLDELDPETCNKLPKTLRGLIGMMGIGEIARLGSSEATFGVSEGVTWTQEEGMKYGNAVFVHLNQILNPDFGKEVTKSGMSGS
jgi:hypothetical protein